MDKKLAMVSPMALRDEELETVAGGTTYPMPTFDLPDIDVTIFGPQVNTQSVLALALGGSATAVGGQQVNNQSKS